MEELLKIIYRNFIETETISTSEELRIMGDAELKLYDSLKEKLKGVLGEEMYEEVDALVTDVVADINEASFIAGFSYCAKFLTNGKTNFFPKGGVA